MSETGSQEEDRKSEEPAPIPLKDIPVKSKIKVYYFGRLACGPFDPKVLLAQPPPCIRLDELDADARYTLDVERGQLAHYGDASTCDRC